MNVKWKALLVICVGIFMSTLDGSILNIANPSIAADYAVSMQKIQWVVTGYMLVITSTLIFFGKLGDRIGSQKVYANGFIIFAGGSFLCSISPSFYFLVTARLIQAFGASMLMATGMGIIANSFPANERGKALGITGSMVGIGNMAGPSFGGFLVASFSWPIIFIINIPIGIAGFFFARRYLPEQKINNNKQRFDYIGIILFAVFAVFLVTFLADSSGINLIISLVCLIIFYFYEKHI